MSIWSRIGKGLLAAAPIVAAPFTAGTSLSALPAVLGGAGAVVGALGQGAAQNRGAQTAATLDRDVIAQKAAAEYENAQQNRAKLDLDQREEAARLQSDAWKKALQSSLALNWSPATRPQGVANISFVGKGIGEQGKTAAEALNRAVTLKLLEGEKFKDLPALERFTPSELPKASTWEKIANILGPSLSIAGKLVKSKQDDDEGTVSDYSPSPHAPVQSSGLFSNLRF